MSVRNNLYGSIGATIGGALFLLLGTADYLSGSAEGAKLAYMAIGLGSILFVGGSIGLGYFTYKFKQIEKAKEAALNQSFFARTVNPTS